MTIPTGYELCGLVLLALNHQPLKVDYRVTCDSNWRTSSVRIEVEGGGETRSLHLEANQKRKWRRLDGENETILTQVEGSVDVDLGVTPATNTLPIRRLNLPVGESYAVTAAWVRFPDLSVEPLAQRYTRLDETRYHYESGGGAFSTNLTVDDFGLVTHYDEGWTLEAFYDGLS